MSLRATLGDMKTTQRGFIVPLLLVIIAVLLLGGGVYVYVQKNQTNQSAIVSATAEATSTVIMRSSDFEVSLNKKDANRVLDSLSGDVSLLIEATLCCSFTGEGNPYSPVDVRNSLLEYVKNSHTFNFSQDQALVGKIKKENPKFENYAIGIADDESVVMYKINTQNKVNDLYLARTYKLLIADANSIDKTANWKTYTNTKYGFSLKYPDINARLKSIGGWTDTNEPRITSKTPFNYDECVSVQPPIDYDTGNKITIAGREYCLITAFAKDPGPNGPISSLSSSYISRIGNEDISISFSADWGTDGKQVDKEARLLFEQILATLKLTSSRAQTADWKTYKDNVIGIQFQYPPTWQPPHTGGEYTDINPYFISMGIFNINVSTTTTGRIGPSGIKNIVVGGEKGIKTSGSGGEGMFTGAQYIFIPLSNRAIRIGYADNGPETNQIYEQIINTIIFVTQ